MRHALKVYYDGSNFAGSQVQPNQRTVEGELLNAFKKLGARVEKFQSAGRTDKGVSAFGNVFAVTTDFKLKARALNNFLPGDIRVLAVREVPEDFNPRYEAIKRIYKYFLFDDGYDIKKIRQTAKLFEGEHSFHNFCILEDKNPVRKINKIAIKKSGGFLVLTFYGESFLWQMARRIVTALKMAGRSEISIEELKKYFEPACKNKFKPSEPEQLILWDVKYNFDFEHEDYSLRKFLSEIFEKQKELKTKVAMGEGMLRNLK
ncbi:MAG: tRNA pseudouridine(38-40) synthase TruA [Candidatus Hydrothermarchaeota archaeon]|nr:tRNA pseudouridine(38-40) synthase TruA [Candidatus Hydrothermarchaeota archaeon]